MLIQPKQLSAKTLICGYESYHMTVVYKYFRIVLFSVLKNTESWPPVPSPLPYLETVTDTKSLFWKSELQLKMTKPQLKMTDTEPEPVRYETVINGA